MKSLAVQQIQEEEDKRILEILERYSHSFLELPEKKHSKFITLECQKCGRKARILKSDRESTFGECPAAAAYEVMES